jgi:prepilin-type processing-associated H-X9-DG protein
MDASHVTSIIRGDQATLSFDLSERQGSETDRLRRQSVKASKRGGQWKLVAPSAPPADSNGHEVEAMLQGIADPESAAANAKREVADYRTLSQIKQLLTGLAMLDAEKGKLATSNKTFGRDLAPYTKDPSLFVSPVTGKRYTFNENLARKVWPKGKRIERLVMVYEGSGGKLEFTHNGQAIVGFADCHVARVTREQARSLLWKP